MSIAKKQTSRGVRYYVVSHEKDAEGGRRTIWHKGGHRTRKDAKLAEQRLGVSVADGDFIAPSDETVADHLRTWVESRVGVKGGIRPRTREEYVRVIERDLIPSIGTVKLQDVRPVHVQRVVRDLSARGLADATVARRYRILAAALANAAKLDKITRNPAAKVDPPAETSRELQVPSPEQVGRIIACADDPYRLAILICAHTGLRRGEVLGLRWCDVSLDISDPHLRVVRSASRVGTETIFTEPKTATSIRQVALTPTLLSALARAKVEQAERRLAIGAGWASGDLVCDAGSGEPIDPSTLTASFRRFAKRARVAGVRLHDLRHAFATHLLAGGVALPVVSTMMGHASITTTTKVYGHLGDTSYQAPGVAVIEAALGGGA
jgi:integrase